jgi:hypothetical protein
VPLPAAKIFDHTQTYLPTPTPNLA